ncbi:MAG: Flp pilus assembly complex ATPase component TadA [Gammaproteobacteria bacterium]|nr:Flp pilus assembly complex ATPase component TadA [Gammaproteobacteria bacterium]
MDTTVDKTELPYPSLLIEDSDIAVGPKSAIIVTLISGKKLKGRLVEFLPNSPTMAVAGKGGEKLVIHLGLIKTLTFPTKRNRKTRQPVLDEAQGVEMPPSSQPFKITFNDGSEVKGETLGYRPDQHGLHLFPLMDENLFIQTFYSHRAIKNYQVGEFLGELLLKDGLVTESDLQQAVETQSCDRKQQLGDYLVSNAIVSSEDLQKALLRQRSMPNMRLGEILVSEGLVNEAQIDEALAAQKVDRGRPLGEILVSQGVVEQIDIQRSLAKKLGIPFVNLAEYQIPPDVIERLGEGVVRELEVIPISMFEGRLVVAMENPMDREAIEVIRFNCNVTVEAVMADVAGIRKAIDFYYSAAAGSEFSDLEIEDDGLDDDLHSQELEQNVSDNLVVKMVNKIVIDAHAQGVSDIHIEPYPGKNKTIIRFRKDGTMLEYVQLPSQYKNALVARIKVMALLDISEKRHPQDGKIDFKKFGPLNIELRVATVPTAAGLEDVVMRILAAGEPIPLDKLGVSDHNLVRLKKLISKPYGMIFVCGPTGSGKTTTLHSILGHINVPERKIWTAEDPVEITQVGLRQVQINPKGGLTFADAMRAFLRADPDVIMVGEMRDKETTGMGIEASLTGHLVFSTLHTNSAPESIVRLLDMGMDPFNFSDALLGVLAQRLAKRLCSECKQAYHPDESELRNLLDEYCSDMPAEGDEAPQQKVLAEWKNLFLDEDDKFTLYKAQGCDHCSDTGYAGRLGLHELLVSSDDIKRAIIGKMPIVDLTRLAMTEGLRTLLQDGIEKVLQGSTDIHCIRAVCSK